MTPPDPSGRAAPGERGSRPDRSHNDEDSLLAWLRRQPGTELVGDDAAILPAGPASPDASGWLATVDSQIAGVHTPADLDAAVAARRLLAVNLSDLAAMGAEPAFALLALAVPADYQHRQYFEAILGGLAEVGARLAGGDLATSTPATATLTLLGRVAAGGQPVTRSAARPGDRLWVGGTLGESGAGRLVLAAGGRLSASGERAHIYLPERFRQPETLADAARQAVERHLRPAPQLALGHWLATAGHRAAAIDLSDGLARDLPRLAQASGVGAEVDAAALPLADGLADLARALDTEPLDLVLTGGEDYVLLFTLPPDTEPPAAFGCHPIGTITEGDERALTVDGVDGERRPLPAGGWDHLEGR